MNIIGYINNFSPKKIFKYSVLVYLSLSISQIVIKETNIFSSNKISWLFSLFSFFVCLPLAVYIFSVSFPAFFKSVFLKIGRFSIDEMNPKSLGLFRVFFFLCSLILIWSTKETNIISNYERSNYFIPLSQLFYLEIIILVLILLGLGGKLPYFLNYVFGSVFLHGDVGTEMFNIVSFWILFTGLDSAYAIKINFKNKILNYLFNYRSPPFRWPIIFMGIHLGYIISTAGVSKCFDGIWDNHYGFYYTFMQPWLKSSILDGLLNYEWLMIAMNWLTIFSEIIALPLLLFKRTRFIGGINLVLMFALLTFVFRIDPIGPFGIMMGLVIIASTKNYTPFKINNDVFEGGGVMFYMNTFFFVALISWLFCCFYIDVKINVNTKLIYPMAGGHFERIEQVDKNIVFPDIFSLPILNVLNPDLPVENINYFFLKSVSPHWYSPFNYYHFVGRVYYKVYVESNGELVEPIKIFNEDGTTNNTDYSGGFLKARVVQNRMWLLGLITHKFATGITFDSLSDKEKKQVEALFCFFSRKFREMGYEGEITIKTRYITIPETFAGNVKLWEIEPWCSILKYNMKKNTIESVEKPELYRNIPTLIKSKIRINPLKNGY